MRLAESMNHSVSKPSPSALACRAALVLALGLLVVCSPSSAQQPQVTWEPREVTQTIGGGDLALPVEVRFRASSASTNVSVFVVPELRNFISVQPAEFPSVQPGIDYTVRLSFAVPPRARQGLYDGTIHLRLGTRTVPQPLKVRVTVDYRGIAPSPEATSLSQDSLQFLVGPSPDGSTLFFSQATPELSSIQAGSILVLPPAPQLPYGFLGRVTNVSTLGAQVALGVVEASLSEAFTSASVELDRPLTEQDLATSAAVTAGVSLRGVRAPGTVSAMGQGLTVTLTEAVLYDGGANGKIALSGSISVDPRLQFSFAVRDRRLKSLQFAFVLTEQAELTLKWGYGVDIEREKEFVRYRWTPITVWVGWVPVVIVPEACLVAGVKGGVEAGIEVGVTQSANLTAGLGYANSAWYPIRYFTSQSSASPPSFTAGANLKVYAGPRFKLLLYGLVGPRADVRAFGELDISLFRNPVWQVWAGLEASTGVLIQLFDRTLASHEFPFLIQYRLLVLQGNIGAPGRIIGYVRDAVTDLPLPGATVAVYRDGSPINLLVTDSSGRFSLQALVGSTYRFDVSRAGYIPVTYNDVTVRPNETKTLDVILQVDSSHAGLGNVSGFVYHALTGAGVPGLAIRLRSGLNSTSGPVVATTTTGSNGAYSFSDLSAGNYTAEASGAGFITSYFPVVCLGNTTKAGQNGIITPILPSDRVQIILTWNASPSDLDSHFTGPLPSGERFHMYYPYADANEGSLWPTIVRLDRDDVNSYGPETTTLLEQMAGVYRFSVHDYTNRDASSSTALSDSQAKVRVYRGANQVASFHVPIGQPGTLWTVFEMEGDTIRPVNTMSYTSSPAGIMSTLTASPEYDRWLLLNLPAKRP